MKHGEQVIYKGIWDRGEYLPEHTINGYTSIPSPPFAPLRGGPSSHNRDKVARKDPLGDMTTLYVHTRKVREGDSMADNHQNGPGSVTAQWTMVVKTGDAAEAAQDPVFKEHIAVAVQEELDLSGCHVTVIDASKSVINNDDLYVTIQASGATANLARVRAPRLEGERVGWVKVIEVQPVTVEGNSPPQSPQDKDEKAKLRP